MTSTITETIIRTIAPLTYDTLSRSFGVIAIVLLVSLLAIKEILRSSGRFQDPAWMRAFDVAVVPLLLVFGFVIFMRFVSLLL
jgi:hypothetical protein